MDQQHHHRHPPPTGGYDGQDVWGAPGHRGMMTEGHEVVMDFFP